MVKSLSLSGDGEIVLNCCADSGVCRYGSSGFKFISRFAKLLSQRSREVPERVQLPACACGNEGVTGMSSQNQSIKIKLLFVICVRQVRCAGSVGVSGVPNKVLIVVYSC